LPENLKDKEYYHPTEQGVETKFKARLAQIKEWKKAHRK
jgi:putative ATPase